MDYASSGAVYDPFSAERLDLYYLYTGSSSVAITITISTNTSNGELQVLKQTCTTIRYHARDLTLPFPHKELFKSHVREDGRVCYLVGPLESLAPRSTEKCFRMFFSDEEVKGPLLSMRMDMDEATGRVFLWEWRGGARTEVFVGDLV